MKIRTQNFITILPIFILMAIATGILNYSTQRQELLWGIKEEVSSLTAASAELIDADLIDRLLKQPDDGQTLNALHKPINRLQIWNQNHRFVLFDPDNPAFVIRFPPDDELAQQFLLPSKQVLVELISGYKNILTTEMTEPALNKRIISSFASVYSHGKSILILGVISDVSWYIEETRGILYENLIVAVCIILFGSFVSILISYILTGKIHQFNEEALVVAAGNYDQRIKIESIQEVSDLSNTFNTMSSVLEDVLSKTKRSIIEGEQFRSLSDLACYFNETFRQPIEGVFHNIELSISLASEYPSGDFFGVFNLGKRTYAILGRVLGTKELDSIMFASAAYTYIKEALIKSDTKKVIENIQQFPIKIEALICLSWDQKADKISVHRLVHSSKKNIVKIETVNLMGEKRNRMEIFHTLNRENEANIELFRNLYGESTPKELMQDIKNIILDDGCGSLILLQKSEMAEKNEPSPPKKSKQSRLIPN
ncbi:MAG: hypothetical protein B6244_02800 [Candidatus Cloacimonetes bacterium 4572_55]|nr:MAG: hypothetical protein B6244_02800 [Candidatus Cloacimonetes bacterium 4572_55]